MNMALSTRQSRSSPLRPYWRAARLALTVALAASVALPLAAVGGCSSAAVEKAARAKKADFHYRLALGYFHNKTIDLAIRDLIEALTLEDDHADSRYLYGFILFGRKRYEEAAEHFRRALRSRPNFFAARNHLGVTLLELERWYDAIQVLDPLLKEPTYTTPYLVYNNIGWAYLKQGDLRRAEKHLKMTVFLNDKFCQGYRNLGLLAVQQRDLDAAEEQFGEAVRRCPKVAEFHLQYGEVLSTNNKLNEAAKAFAACHTLAGKSLMGRRCKARLSDAGGGYGPRSP